MNPFFEKSWFGPMPIRAEIGKNLTRNFQKAGTYLAFPAPLKEYGFRVHVFGGFGGHFWSRFWKVFSGGSHYLSKSIRIEIHYPICKTCDTEEIVNISVLVLFEISISGCSQYFEHVGRYIYLSTYNSISWHPKIEHHLSSPHTLILKYSYFYIPHIIYKS